MFCQLAYYDQQMVLPYRLYNMVDEQLKWFTTQFPDTVLPRELLRNHLTEVISPAMLNEQSSYLGNRLAACTAQQQSLFFSCCGSASHKLAMTGADNGAFQVRYVGMLLCQVCASLSLTAFAT